MTNPEYAIRPIGAISRDANAVVVRVNEDLRAALKGLDEFRHVQVFW